jgi:RNA-binding protein
MISTKDRAILRGMAQKQEPIVLIGKGGITDAVIESIGLVLEKRELIKIKLLQNSGLESKTASAEVCEKLGADGVQCIGSVFVIYRRSKRKDVKHIL